MIKFGVEIEITNVNTKNQIVRPLGSFDDEESAIKCAEKYISTHQTKNLFWYTLISSNYRHLPCYNWHNTRRVYELYVYEVETIEL